MSDQPASAAVPCRAAVLDPARERLRLLGIEGRAGHDPLLVDRAPREGGAPRCHGVVDRADRLQRTPQVGSQLLVVVPGDGGATIFVVDIERFERV